MPKPFGTEEGEGKELLRVIREGTHFIKEIAPDFEECKAWARTALRTTGRKTSTYWNGPLTDIGMETSRGYASTRSNIKKEKEGGIEPGQARKSTLTG